jgi:hypothetical protein
MVSSPFAMSRAQIEESVARYLQQLDTADRQEPSEVLAAKTARLEEKIVKLKAEMQRLAALETRMLVSPDQLSLTDVDSRSMATSGRGSGVVGYNVQVAGETEHHLIVTHEVTNVGSDRAQLSGIATAAKAAFQVQKLEAVADRGYLDPGLRPGGYHGNAAKADDVGRKVRGAFRQAGLRLSAGGGRLSLPRRRAPEVLLRERGKRAEAAPLLDDRLSNLHDQKPLHHRRAASHHPLGARARA